ncbi:hypothetical protein ACSBOB_20260 [Mesorhizobium sp. ASY16-5R]|uniref:hypothetical protein n=1 Tax=Mesorhizobium sp. ASY16-5R TaxID=3445772 RepID=UPI003FA10F84
MGKELATENPPVVAVNQVQAPMSLYEVRDFDGAVRMLRQIMTRVERPVDEVKAKIFKSHRLVVILDYEDEDDFVYRPQGYVAEIHRIFYDIKYEDTVGIYDVPVDRGDFYEVFTFRYEIVDGALVECGQISCVNMDKSDYHLRRRKRRL